MKPLFISILLFCFFLHGCSSLPEKPKAHKSAYAEGSEFDLDNLRYRNHVLFIDENGKLRGPDNEIWKDEKLYIRNILNQYKERKKHKRI